jgi:glycosyltransferase involved in cell wall biosynthesis
MRNVCLISNYNYGHYLRDCLGSVLSQQKQFDLVVIVDDGSTDDSKGIIENFCSNCNYATAIFKENGGQLSCFNAAAPLIRSDDFIYFLDADDLFPADYLLEVSNIVGAEGAEFAFCNHVEFSSGNAVLPSARITAECTFTFASTSALTRKVRCWIGEATSCICMNGELYQALLPYPREEDWVTRADDVLVYGASIIGSQKLYLAGIGVNYRIHESNNFVGKQLSPQERLDYRRRQQRLFEHYCKKKGISQSPRLQEVLDELAAIPKAQQNMFAIPSYVKTCLFDITYSLSPLILGAKRLLDWKRI